MSRLDVRPPDLEMRILIAAEHGRTRLRYSLHSPLGTVALSHREIEGPLLQRSPDDYQAFLLAKFEKLGESVDIDGSLLLRGEIERKLASLGRELWYELFPPELRTVYREVLRPSVRSWVIVSDEPWIPWELVKPYDDSGSGEPLDDDFLCLRFELTRWLAGGRPFVSEIEIRRLAVLQSAPDLPHAREEREVFTRLKESFPAIDVLTPRLEAASDLTDFLLSTDTGLVHLIGHGVPMARHPDEAGLPFADRSVFRPTDLHGALATHLARQRPLVFLNACWTGKEGWSLARLGGWAARWIGECGCGAFVAPLFPVRDPTAVTFAWSFYEALARGATLGEAALKARRETYAQHPADPSALAYTFYGNPHSVIHFRESRPPREEAETGVTSPTPRWRPRRRRPRWIRQLALAGGLTLLLSLAVRPFGDRLYPVDPRPKALPRPEPPKVTQKAKPQIEVCGSVPGLRLRLSGGQAGLRHAFKTAFCRSAAPLSEVGLSGWTIGLTIDPPQVNPVGPGPNALLSCQVTGQATASGPKSQLGLGPVRAVNAQFSSALACEGAAASLAQTVVSRLEAALSKEGEP